jgi:Ca-activated chloride channel family protein
MLKDWLHIEFAYPWLLPLLLIVPFILFWYWRNHYKTSASVKVTTTFFLKHKPNWRVRFRHLPIIFRSLGLLFLILALARPQEKFTEDRTKGEGIDIVLCFDISGSMTETDILPNRLEASKEVASDFVRRRPGDRIGVVIFSSKSFTLCPITTDHNTVLHQVNAIQNGYLVDEGTAIGSGLATSVDRLRQTASKSKVVILLTDGVDFGGIVPPDIAKEMAKLYGIKVYTIGVGSERDVDTPVETPFGTQIQKRKVEYNENLLKTLATETGGQYFHAVDKASLQKIYSSIDTLEKSKVEITTYDRFTDKFIYPLLIGVGFIILELILRLSFFRKFP